MKTATGLMLGVALMLAAGPAAADDWPQFRGPNRDGKSSETGLLKQWPASGPKKLWTATGCGKGFGSVSVAGGGVYTMGTIGQDMCVIAFDLNGKKKWQKAIGPNFDRARAGKRTSYRGYAGSRSTPTYDAGKLYVETPMTDVACLDAATGEILWSIDMYKKFGARNSIWAMAESLLVVGEKVILQPAGPNAGVVAVNKADGSVIWKSAGIDDAPGYASPVVVDHGGRQLLLIMSKSHAVGLDLATGKVLWKHYYQNKWWVNATNPIYYQGYVFISSGYGLGSALLKLNDAGTKATGVWSSKTLDDHHGGVVQVGGYVYGCDSNGRGRWYCMDIMTGEVAAKAVGKIGKGSCVYADGMLYCYAEKGGVVSLVRATPGGLRVVSRFAIPNAGGDRRVWAHPAISNGVLYLRHQNSLHAYDIKAR